MNLVTRLNLGIEAYGTTTVGLDTITDPLRKILQYHWETGTGANQANQLYTATGTILASTAATFDLVGGGLVDAFGTAISLTRVKWLWIYNTHATQPFVVTTNLTATVTATLRPGGTLISVQPDATGLAVSAGADTITMTNGSGSSTTYQLAIGGTQ